MVINNKKLILLTRLRKNARESLTKMSKETSIPISTLYELLKRTEKMLIKKYTVIINFSKLGYPLLTEILFKVNSQDKIRAQTFLEKSFNINKVLKINNDFDFLIEGYFKNLADVDNFLGIFERKFQVINRKIFYVSREISNERFMSNQNLLDLAP